MSFKAVPLTMPILHSSEAEDHECLSQESYFTIQPNNLVLDRFSVYYSNPMFRLCYKSENDSLFSFHGPRGKSTNKSAFDGHKFHKTDGKLHVSKKECGRKLAKNDAVIHTV